MWNDDPEAPERGRGRGKEAAPSPPPSKRGDAAQITRSIEALTRRWESEEASAGIAAFFDRKPPPWAP